MPEDFQEGLVRNRAIEKRLAAELDSARKKYELAKRHFVKQSIEAVEIGRDNPDGAYGLRRAVSRRTGRLRTIATLSSASAISSCEASFRKIKNQTDSLLSSVGEFVGGCSQSQSVFVLRWSVNLVQYRSLV